MKLPPDVAPRSTPRRKRPSPYRPPVGRPPEHGQRLLTRVLRTVKLDTIDQRSQVGVALRRLREEMTADLGGDEEITAAQRILIEEAAKARIIAQAVRDYILRQESIVKDGGELLPAEMQHSALVANLGRMLERLGLERKAREAKTPPGSATVRGPHFKRPCVRCGFTRYESGVSRGEGTS